MNNDFLTLGLPVRFDGPDGERLDGIIITNLSNPDYYLVEAGEKRFEVSRHVDNLVLCL